MILPSAGSAWTTTINPNQTVYLMEHINIDLNEYAYPVYQDMAIVHINGNRIAKAILGLYSQPLQLVCRGSSGILIAGEVQRYLPYATIHYARKDNEREHSSRLRLDTGVPIVIIDDMVCTGKTMRAIRDQIEAEYPQTLSSVEGVCCYSAWGKRETLDNMFPSLKYIFS